MTKHGPPYSSSVTREEAPSLEENDKKWLHRPLYQKPASEFGSEEIPLLALLEEGWFVEFKERLPDSAKLARSISSFANSHGGILVIGAMEEQKTRRLAQFTPMRAEVAEQCIVRSREAVTSHVTPPPFFEAKAIEIETLEATSLERWIVVVSVPKGTRGPYLHSNGCIYVRVGDAAAPHPLADLNLQERMWSESLSRKARMAARVEMLSEQCRHGAPSVHLVMLVDDVYPHPEETTFEGFRDIALGNLGGSAVSVFDHVQTLDTSFIARRTELSIDGSSLIWDYDGPRKLHFIQIPVATLFWSGDKLDNHIDQFGLDALAARLSSKNAPHGLMILNLLPTVYFLSIILYRARLLHLRQGFKGELKLNARVVDAKGTVPFLGTPSYFNEVDATNFPYVVRDVGSFRNLDDPATWFTLAIEEAGEESDLERNLQIDLLNALGVFSRIAQTLGISPYVSFGIRSDDASGIDWQPIAGLLSDLYNRSFSFASQRNPKASQ